MQVMHIVPISACVCVLSTVASNGGRLSSKVIDSEEDDGGMRRACSLSDLTVSPPNRLLHGPVQGTLRSFLPSLHYKFTFEAKKNKNQ